MAEVEGSKLYQYLGDTESQLSKATDISVYNACFAVDYTPQAKYPFAVRVKNNFRYLKAANATGDDLVHLQKNDGIALNVIEHGGKYYLATSAGTAGNIFKFGESGLVNPLTELLKTNGASVYNIKFVSGANDKTEKNKYLTTGVVSGAWDFVAKGEALAENVLATPAYQFVITDINEKTSEVTFTNRESGTSFVAKLFHEDDNKYSFAVATGSDSNFLVANINKSTYGVDLVKDAAGNKNFAFNSVLVELEPSTVDPYAGFWNVADGTTVTMAFARDINNTSNIIYAYGKANSSKTEFELTDADNNNYANLTEDLYDAAQWRLKKLDEVKTIKRDYVYRGENGQKKVAPFGDIISVPQYQLEYIYDADQTGAFLTADLLPEAQQSGYTTYIIRNNADGSVSLIETSYMKSNTSSTIGEFADDSQDLSLEKVSGKFEYSYKYLGTYNPEAGAEEIRTFLLTEAPYKSWKNEGHVTIQSEVGNFLSMNKDRDAIMVDNEGSAYYLYKTDEDAVAPSYYITKGMGSENGERLFLFNPVDSIGYQMTMPYDPKYQWSEDMSKLVFKPAIINETRDTLALTVKGEVSKLVADKEDNKNNIWGGLNRFKFQIVETEDGDGYYYIRQNNNNKAADGAHSEGKYLGSISEKVTWTEKKTAIKFRVAETEAPTSNESVSASEVKVIANNGSINVKNAAGKNVVVSTILGQVVANEVLTSDNATINVPAGIVVVAVEGESFKVNVK